MIFITFSFIAAKCHILWSTHPSKRTTIVARKKRYLTGLAWLLLERLNSSGVASLNVAGRSRDISPISRRSIGAERSGPTLGAIVILFSSRSASYSPWAVPCRTGSFITTRFNKFHRFIKTCEAGLVLSVTRILRPIPCVCMYVCM